MDYRTHVDTAYEAELAARFRARMPKKVFDAHCHLSADEIPSVPPHEIFGVYKERTEIFLGEGRLQGGFLMGNPKRFPNKEALDAERRFTVEQAQAEPGFVAGLLVTPKDSIGEICGWVEKHPCIAGLKPYHTYAPMDYTFEADITDYAPEWMWELADDKSLAMMIHLSHYGDMLRDPANGKQLQELRAKYPKAKIILAHCAMGHHPDKLKSGLQYIEGMENLWVDCSGVSEALSVIYCLQALGHEKVLYGSDGFGFGQKPGCVRAVGGNFLGIHEPVALPPDYRYMPLPNICEGLLALFAAGDLCGLTQTQWEDIFYTNAAHLYERAMKRK